METFAFTHVAAEYEASGAVPSLREFNLPISTVAATGITGSVAVLSLVVSAPDAQALIRRGDVCAAVGDVQRALVNLNYSTGGVDNVFGSATESAVRSFQANRGLLVDGVVGSSTASVLGVSSSSCGGGVDGGSTGGGGLATVTASALNVRTGPSTANAVSATLFRGAQVKVTGTSGTWSSIVTSNAEGWVASQYLSTGGGSTGGGSTGGGSTGGAAGTYVVATASNAGVRVRSTPNGAIVGSLAEGASVSLTSVRQVAGGYTWAQMTNGNWVATSFLSASSGGSTGGGSTGGGSTGGGSTGGGSTGGGAAAGTYMIDTPSNTGVRIRSTPNGAIAGSLGEGATVSVTSVRQTAGGYTWAQLTSGNWVATAFLR